MTTYQTSELTGYRLDFAVGMCEGLGVEISDNQCYTWDNYSMFWYSPSSSWIVGGNLVDDYDINFRIIEGDERIEADLTDDEGIFIATGIHMSAWAMTMNGVLLGLAKSTKKK